MIINLLSLARGITASSKISSGEDFGDIPSDSIGIFSGEGYNGSVYGANYPTSGQWHADDVAISGATSKFYTMTVANEGKSITFKTGATTSNAIQLFVPSQLTGLLFWVDAADTSTLTLTGSVVTTWASKVGSLTATQATEARRPTWSATGRNGRQAILSSSGSSQFFNFSSVTGLPTTTATSHVLATAYHSTPTRWRGLYYTGNGGSGANRLILKNTGNNAGLYTGAGAGDTATTATWLSTDHIVSGVFTNTRNQIILDGDTVTAAKNATRTGTYSTTTTAGMLLSNYNNQYWDGALHELMIFNRELTSTERQKVEGYKAAKWNLRTILPSDHPYKSSSPTA